MYMQSPPYSVCKNLCGGLFIIKGVMVQINGSATKRPMSLNTSGSINWWQQKTVAVEINASKDQWH